MLKHMKGFLMQLAWEPLLETHHRLEQGLCPNVFTPNYVVASTACIKSILKTKIPLLLMIDPQTMLSLLVWFV